MAAALMIATTACVAGAPLGFGEGDHWGVPLVGALEDGPLIAPVYIDGEGPFLFQLNPHSRSIIDYRLARTLGLYTYRTEGGITDESDRIAQEKIDYAEVKRVRLGTLTVRNRTFLAIDNDLTYKGWPIRGIIGEEVIDDTLIWTIDRDRQMFYLATQGHRSPPPGATRIKAHRIDDQRFFVTGRIDDRKAVYLFADLVHPQTSIWPEVADEAGLTVMDSYAFDWFGRRLYYRDCWQARSLQVGSVRTNDLVIHPYADKRIRHRDWDGRLGRSFFARYHVTVNWHEKSIWLAPRAEDLGEHASDRLRRWSTRFEMCDAPACITFERRKGTGGSELWIRRDPRARGTLYDVLIEAVGPDGKPLSLPRLIAVFPDDATTVVVAGSGGTLYSAAPELRVVDLSPFPAKCEPIDPTRGCAMIE